jgi:hypothetical protein
MDLGPQNTGWSHFATDRPRFYFNQEVRVDSGRIGSYDEDLSLRAAGATHVTVKQNTGRMGIGTTTPDRQLTVQGSGSTYINVKGGSGIQEVLLGADVNGGVLSTMTNHDLQIRAGGNSTKMTVKANGRVGIGTLSPSSTLDVNGEIRVKGVKPFAFKKINMSGSDVNTFFSTANTVVGVVGCRATTGDIGSSGDFNFRVYPYRHSDGYWHISADFRSVNNQHESWEVWVMAVRNELATRTGGY